MFLAAVPPKSGTGIPSQDSLLWVFGTAQSKAVLMNKVLLLYKQIVCFSLGNAFMVAQ